jgi:hypothetical protein
MGSRQSHALIECHGNIGTERFLDLDRDFRSNEMPGTVQMRLKSHPIVRHLAQFCQAEDLKSSAIRQHRARPTGEGMEPTQFSHDFMSGTQVKMVGIVQDKPKSETLKVIRINAFYGTQRTDRHKRRSLDLPMRSG